MNVMQMGAKVTREDWRDNYQTPPYILALVNEIFGFNWFDPCPINPQFDSFKRYTSQNRFINPPFSNYQAWVDHWLYQPGEQIWICHTNNSSGWFKQLMAEASAMALLHKRINFIDPRTGFPSPSSAIGKSQSLIYVGENPERFCEVFGTVAYTLRATGKR